jgi:hypothetical protein
VFNKFSNLCFLSHVLLDDKPASRHYQESHNVFICRVKQYEKSRLLDCFSADLKALQSSEILALYLSTWCKFLEALNFQYGRCEHLESRTSMFQTDYIDKDPD